MSDSQPPPPPPPPPPDNLNPPPGYVPYGNAPTPLERVRRVSGVSKALVILTAIAGVVAAISGVVSQWLSGRAADYLRGDITRSEFEDNLGAFGLVQALGAVQIAVVVLTMIWMYRIAANARAFGRATFWAPLWAVFGWFLPPVLFIIPLLMLRELWKASVPETPATPDGWKQESDSPMLWLWWVFFALVPIVLAVINVDTLVLGGFGGGTDEIAETLEDVGALNLVGGLNQLVAAVFWILFVRQLTQRHTHLTNER